MTENKKEKNFKNNSIVYLFEVLILSAAAVFLSVIGAGMFIHPLGMFCIITSSALFACVLFLTVPGVIIPAGVASFSFTAAMGGSMTNAASSLIYIIVAMFIYFGLKNKKNANKRITITVGIAGVLSAFYIILLVLSVVISSGRFSVNSIASAVDNQLTGRVENYIEQYYAVVPQYSAITPDELDAYKTELVLNIKVVVPALFVLYNAVIAYLSTALFKTAYNFFIPMANPGRKKIKNKYWRINITSVSAIVLIISIFLAAVLFDRYNLLPSIVFMNLIYILAPGFCIVGIYFLFDKISGARASGTGLLPVILILGAFVFAFFIPFIAFSALYFAIAVFMVMGLYATLIGDIKKFCEKTKKLLLGDDEDDDDDYLD